MMEIPLLIGAIIAGVIGAFVISNWMERQRTREYEAAARKLGLEFHPEGDPSLMDAHGNYSIFLGNFAIFQQGHARKLRNLIRGKTNRVDVAIFDYSYTVGGGDSSSTHRQTIIRFDSPVLNLPTFELRPAQMSDRLGRLFGKGTIALSEFPAFSQKYSLRGESEAEIHEAFTLDVVQHLETLSGLHIAGAGPKLIVYRPGKRLKGYEIRPFLEEAFEVYSVFKITAEEIRASD